MMIALTASTAAAQLTLDRLVPSVVSSGSELTVTAEGTFPDWPVEARCDREEVTVAAGEESGELTVRVSEDAAPGVAWVRLVDERSASALLPLLIESLPLVVESEPNDQIAEAQSISLPAVIAGRLEKRGDVDGIAVSLQAGETLVASLVAKQLLGSPMDGLLQVADRDGNVLAQADDDCGLDPQLIFRAETDEEVIVRVFAFPETATSSISFAGDAAFLYALRLTSGPFLDHVTPIATGAPVEEATAAGWNLPDTVELTRTDHGGLSPPTWTAAEASGWFPQPSLDDDAVNVAASSDPKTPARTETLPAVFSGRITQAGQVDRLQFQVRSGTRYLARSHSRSRGFLVDPVLRIVDTDGSQIAEKDDQSRTNFEATLEFTAEEDAEFELEMFDAVNGFGPRHSYSVWIGEVAPQVQLRLDADHFSLAAGETLEIPVTVKRLGGFPETVAVTAEGLPEGVSAAEAVSEPKGDSSKSVNVTLSADEGVTFQGSFRIVGALQGPELQGPELQGPESENEQAETRYRASYPLSDETSLTDFWLSVAEKE